MDSSEECLERIEAQRSTGLINNSLGSLRSRDSFQIEGECTESVPEFFINLRLSDLFDLPGEYVHMDAEMCGGLSDGNKEWLEILRTRETPIACLRSCRGDSILHLVAAWGHLELVKTIVSECPCLLLEPNLKDQLPLHVAAFAGQSAVVKALVDLVTFVSVRPCEGGQESVNLYVVKDIDGDTPLHSALKGHNMETALCLVMANRQASFLANQNAKSPLFLAVKAGDVSLVKAMLGNDGPEGTQSNLVSQLEGKRYLAHAALELKSTDILDAVLDEFPSLVDERDEEGRTCLSFGAAIGNYEGVCNLLDRSTKGVFVCDIDGSFPIHVAVEKGHIKVVKEILKRCPSSKHMLNKKDQNILHIVAEKGKYEMLLHLRESRETALPYEQDVDGNTPLHLATIKRRPRAAFLLKGMRNVFIQNNSGLTALDIAETNLQPHYIFRERLTLLVLSIGIVPRSGILVSPRRPLVSVDSNGYKDYINTLLLVAALVATVTFAAGFTIPGGFNSSAPNLGMATLATQPRLIAFLIFNMVAMQSSVLAVVSLMWAQLEDPALRRTFLDVALRSLYVALVTMSFAFLFGMVIAAGNATGLIIAICIIFTFFFLGMHLILIPHVLLQRPLQTRLRKPLTQYMFMNYLKVFIRFVNDDDDEGYQTSTNMFEEGGQSPSRS